MRLAKGLAVGTAALLLSAMPHTARAQAWIAEPDYVLSIWLRVGFTSKGVAATGLALDLLPFTAGIDVAAARNELGRFRIFAGLKGAREIVPVSCKLVLGVSGALVYAFGPGQPGHFGVQLGAHVEDRPIAGWGASAPPTLSFPQTEVGGFYRFSLFPTARTLHDVNLGVGLLWAPNGFCGTD
jgi:hypothetical protein